MSDQPANISYRIIVEAIVTSDNIDEAYAAADRLAIRAVRKKVGAESSKVISVAPIDQARAVFELLSEDITNAGGPMGSKTTTNFTKLFADVNDAMAFAEKDFGKSIEWKEDKEVVRSPDLGYVMYRIKAVEVL